MNLNELTRDFILDTLSSLLAAFVIYLMGSTSIKKNRRSFLFFNFALPETKVVRFASNLSPSLSIRPRIALAAIAVGCIAALADIALPSETFLTDPQAIINQANFISNSALGEADGRFRQAQQEGMQMIADAERETEQLRKSGKKEDQARADKIIEDARTFAAQRVQWTQELSKRNVDDARKRASDLQAQADQLQKQIDKSGRIRQNHVANFINALLWGLTLVAFLGAAAHSFTISVKSASGYAAAGFIVATFSLVALASGESTVSRSCEALLVAAALFASSQGTFTLGETLLNAFGVISQRILPALKAFILCNLIAGVLAALISAALGALRSTLMQPNMQPFFDPSKLYWKGQALQIIQIGEDVTTGFVVCVFSAVVGALFLSSLRGSTTEEAENQPFESPSPLSLVYRSFYSRTLYRGAGRVKGIGGFKYLAIVVVLASASKMTVVQAHLSRFVNNQLEPFLRDVTPITLSADGADSAGDSRLRLSPNGRVIAVINTTDAESEAGDSDAVVTLYKEGVGVRLLGVPAIGWNLSDSPDTTIEYDDLAVWGRIAKRWLLLAIFPIWATCSFVYWSCITVLPSSAIPLLGGSRFTNIAPGATRRITTIAVTPAIISSLVCYFLGVPPQASVVISLAFGASYLLLGLSVLTSRQLREEDHQNETSDAPETPAIP